MQDCTQTMVVTNHEFTPAARKLAERHGCELVGGADLPRLRSTIRRLTDPDADSAPSEHVAHRVDRGVDLAATPSARAGTARCRLRWPA